MARKTPGTPYSKKNSFGAPYSKKNSFGAPYSKKNSFGAPYSKENSFFFIQFPSRQHDTSEAMKTDSHQDIRNQRPPRPRCPQRHHVHPVVTSCRWPGRYASGQSLASNCFPSGNRNHSVRNRKQPTPPITTYMSM